MIYKIKRLFSIKNGYLFSMILLIAFICISTFSYALFTASAEREGALNIVSGNLYSLITSNNLNKEKQITIDPDTSKTIEIKLTNVNSVDAKFNLYYSTTHDNIEIGYIKYKNTPPTEAGILLKQNGDSGDRESYLIEITNKDTETPVTITFGSDVGLVNKDLTFPTDKHILSETKTTSLFGLPITDEDNYNDISEEDQHKMFTFIHKNDETEDVSIDYRYIGNDPYNYLKFESDDTIWRIIGIFNDKSNIKIMRDESIGNVAWDTENDNNWSKPSSLNNLLNTGDFYNNLNDKIKEKIEDVDWYLGGIDNSSYDTETIYKKERENKDNKSIWKGKIGLMYLSDYGYTYSKGIYDTCFNNLVDFNSCNDYKNKSWMYIDENSNELTINRSYLKDKVFSVSSDGTIKDMDANNDTSIVRPVMYLKKDIKIISGNGSKETPYIIE